MTSNVLDYTQTATHTAPAPAVEQTIQLQAYCYDDRIETLPEIMTALARRGGWVLDRRTVSSTAVEVTLQVQLDAVLELYGALMEIGLELTRAAHTALTDLCVCRRYQECSTDEDKTLTVRLGVTVLADVTLHSILMTGSSLA